jgi:hypothetical protein
MNPLENGSGKVYLVPLNMVPAGQAPAAGRNVAAGQAANAMRGLYVDTLERILRREKNDLGTVAKKYLAQGDTRRFLTWMDEFYGEHTDFIRRQLRPLAESHAEALLPGDQGNKAFIETFLDDYARNHVDFSQRSVKEVVLRAKSGNHGDICADLDTVLEGWMSARAAETAMKTSVKFGNELIRALPEGEYERN